MHVFYVCAYMDTYVCVWLEKKEGCVRTCVISYLLLKYRCLCGKQVVKQFIVPEFRKWRVFYPFIPFPMLGRSFHLKN